MDKGKEITSQSKSGRDPYKAKFLDVMSKTNIVSTACSQAGISRDTFYRWCKEGYISELELTEAFNQYCDLLRAELYKRAMVGVEKAMYMNGKPILDADGKPVMTRIIDNKVLVEMCKRILPEMRDESSKIDVHVQQGDAPSKYIISFDYRDLTPDERALLKKIAQDVNDRQNGVIDADTAVVAASTAYDDRFRSN